VRNVVFSSKERLGGTLRNPFSMGEYGMGDAIHFPPSPQRNVNGEMDMIIKCAISILLTVAITWALSSPSGAYLPFKTMRNTAYQWNIAALQNKTIQWHLNANVPAIAGDSMQAGLQAWSDATGGAFSFAQGSGGISVDWDTDGSMVPDPLFLAYTTFNADNTGFISSARIIVNAHNYTWHRGGYGGVEAVFNGVRDSNLDSVILHELGHALGLDHSDKYPALIVGTLIPGDPPTMNSVIYAGAGTLHDDDKAGIRSIYATAMTPPSAINVSASVQSGKAPMKVVFTQIGGDDSTNWDFGDGSNTTGMSANHVFTANGTFTVKVNCMGTTSSTIILVGTKAIRADVAAKAKAARDAKQKEKHEKRNALH
jgi:hypothetical protein